MALLYNEGCEYSEGDLTKCNMNICHISQNKFVTSLCKIHSPVVDIKKPSNNNLNDLSKNVFTHEYNPSNFHSRITILSNNDRDGILLLYEYNPYHNKYPEKTYLCRLRNIKQKLTLCEYINMEYIGRSLTFDSYDIINEESKNNNMISLKNPNHKIIKSKYDKLIFKEHFCHHMKTKYISYCNKRNTICKKINNDQLHCTDANYSGHLIKLDHIEYYVLKRKHIYLPSGCLKENLNPVCTPHICISHAINEFFECEYQEISVIKNIRPIKKIMPIKEIRPIKNIRTNSNNLAMTSLKHEDIYHKNSFYNTALFAMSFMSFLVLFTFFFCLLYRTFRKKRRKIN
ncbi:fam-e protein [Plasmodium gallinaceum]|uniref:Fam-e protein n=1 Tax=Plasmodium gallinaceum TaxID=5849 RepID=A0A1J1GNP1_PLAGA|nr:fam-e protein [Plasmodium gallinaceum]CRG94074.1 fam-e protein [Plasmodium gallinaceum]